MPGKRGMPRVLGTALQERLARVEKRLSEGWTYAAIAEAEGVTPGAIREAFRRHRGGSYVFHKTCALAECAVEFTTTYPQKLYCCPLHSKRGNERTRVGKVTEYRPCRLPECDESVLCVNTESPTSRRYCSGAHGDRHLARVSSGYYDRLVERTSCRVCGWWGPGVEQHHIKPKSEGGSDHPNNLVWLCANCHRLVHGALGRIDHRRRFTDLREDMRERELARRKVWGE